MALAAFRNLLIAFAVATLLDFGLAFAGTEASRSALDQSRIHGFYKDGEFDKVIKELEGFLRTRRACTHADSVFVEKHLSVVYAAHPSTRELGRYHMYRLLDLAPGTELLDMFVGEEVGGVFEKVGKEYALRNPSRIPVPKSAAAPVGSGAKAVSTASSASTAPASQAAKARPTLFANARKPHSAEASATTPRLNSVRFALSSRPARPAYPAVPAGPVASVPAPVTAALTSSASPASPSSFISFPSSSPRVAPGDSLAIGKTGSDSRPAWKEPGLWIGGGAAFAVVAFTLFYSGADEAPAGKTYVVPATAAR